MRFNLIRSLAFLAFLFAFASASLAADAPQQPKKEAATAVHPDYVVGAEDVLDISVWKNADLSRVVTVRPDGMISLPLIGDIKTSGLTPEQLKSAIEKKLREYSETAVVSVIVQTVNSYKIYMVGQVQTPGTLQLKSKTTVLQAIAMAGGLTPFAAKNKIVIIRKKTGGAGEEKIRVRFNDLVYDDEDKNPVLKPGDTIFVP